MSRMTDEQVQALANEYAYKAVPFRETESPTFKEIRTAIAHAYVHGFAACDGHWCDRTKPS